LVRLGDAVHKVLKIRCEYHPWRLKVTVKPVEVNSDRALYGSKYPLPFGESIAKTDVNGKSKLVYEQPDSLSTGNLY
jgi:hypothetical protein